MYTYIYVYTCIHTYKCIYVCLHIYNIRFKTCHIHIHTLSCIHVYIIIYIYTCSCVFQLCMCTCRPLVYMPVLPGCLGPTHCPLGYELYLEPTPRLGVDYYCFHDVDVAPQGSNLQDFQKNLDVISDKRPPRIEKSVTSRLQTARS